MVSVGQEFWIVAAGCDKDEKDGFSANVFQSIPLIESKVGPFPFPIPEGLPFGGFDNLVSLTDALTKADSQLDSIVHRLERQYVELDSEAKFMIKAQRQEKTLIEYLTGWEWDEAKYPKSRTVSDNLSLLTSVVQKLDEEVRSKTAQYNEVKTAKTNTAKKEAASLFTQDLTDLLIPDKVTMKGTANDDFFETEYMSTVCVIVSRGNMGDFLNLYETFSEDVVPGSAKKFTGFEDKDGNMLFRVVVMKTGLEAFKKGCREQKFVPRDFFYSKETYETLLKTRAELETKSLDSFQKLCELCQAAWSDVMVAWFHVKAMRVYVECVLRYGMGTPFAPFVIVPKSGLLARAALAEALKSKKGKAIFSAEKLSEAAAEDGEEYFSYVSFTFTPFTATR